MSTSNRSYPEKWRLMSFVGEYRITADSIGVYVKSQFGAEILLSWHDLRSLEAAALEEHLGENGELRAVHIAADMIAGRGKYEK